MILIRGIKGIEFAKKIENGIVDCRDILSALLKPPITGYEYSDYYEKNLAKALLHFSGSNATNINNPYFLYTLLTDPYIPHIYLTYFHILNEKSLDWLDKFDDDHHFIAINVKLDKITKTAIGNEYFGARMTYVDDIRTLNQNTNHPFQIACLCSIENLFTNKSDINTTLQIYNTLNFPLLCREQDDKFTDIENEFRIIAYDCPITHNGNYIQKPRNVTITGESGRIYQGNLHAMQNTIFKSNFKVVQNPQKTLQNILLEENGRITLNSNFKSIDIRTVSDDFKYIGNRNDCKTFIINELSNIQPDIYVERTIRKTFSIDDLKNPRFFPGYKIVNY